MISRLLILFVAALGGCGEAGPSDAGSDQGSVAITLPDASFVLDCLAAKGGVPEFAKSNFRIRVNPKAETYAFSHWSGGERPIKTIRKSAIIFREEVIERGRGNSSETWQISYDLLSKNLNYRESFNGIVHFNYRFTTRCEIV